eukprot:1146520-Pelagomonas_calceolata.AAC.4
MIWHCQWQLEQVACWFKFHGSGLAHVFGAVDLAQNHVLPHSALKHSVAAICSDRKEAAWAHMAPSVSAA